MYPCLSIQSIRIHPPQNTYSTYPTEHKRKLIFQPPSEVTWYFGGEGRYRKYQSLMPDFRHPFVARIHFIPQALLKRCNCWSKKWSWLEDPWPNMKVETPGKNRRFEYTLQQSNLRSENGSLVKATSFTALRIKVTQNCPLEPGGSNLSGVTTRDVYR